MELKKKMETFWDLQAVTIATNNEKTRAISCKMLLKYLLIVARPQFNTATFCLAEVDLEQSFDLAK